MSEEQGRDLVRVEPFAGVLATQQSRAVFLPANLAQAMELAHFMSGGIGVRQWMRGNPSACLALIQISMRWGMDPYIVSNKAYYANDTLSFESQLVNAVLNTCGELIGRLKVEFSGDAAGAVGKETLNCRVSGRIKADPDQPFVHEQALQTITIRNSPLWKVNPKQQLQYYTTRAWARLYLPEILLGIYTPDEIADGVAQRIEDQSTPRGSAKAPDRRDFTEEEAGRRLGAAHTDCGEPGHKTADCSCFRAAVEEEAEFEPIETVVAKEEPADGSAAAVDAAEETADVHSDNPEPESDTASVASVEPAADSLPLVEEKHILDTVPGDEDQWNAWADVAREAIGDVETRPQFNALRRRIAPAMDKASEAILIQIQDALADRHLELPGEKK